jgi:hypothetical protein
MQIRGTAGRPGRNAAQCSVSRASFRVLSSPAIFYIIICLFSEECRTPGVAAPKVL